MSDAELSAWLEEHPMIIAYLAVMAIASLSALVLLIRQVVMEKRIRAVNIGPWRIAGSDFALFVCCIVAWFGLSGGILVGVVNLFGGEITMLVQIASGILLQSGLLFIFALFHQHFRRIEETPLSPRILSQGAALIRGFWFFLASLPVVYLINGGWHVFLETMRQLGYDLNFPVQDAVQLFSEANGLLEWILLVSLAVLVAPVVEEFVFRAGLYRFFKGKMKVFWAMLWSSLLFSAFHGNVMSFPGLAVVGFALCLAYELSGNIRVAIYFHAFFNLHSVVWIFILPDGIW